MKKIAGFAALAAIISLSLTGCAGWSTTATVGGGTGWYAGNAPYYWSDWYTPSAPPIIGNGPGSIAPAYRPRPPRPIPTRPGNGPAFNPGGPGNNPGGPSLPPAQGNGPGSNPGSPQQGGFRGER